MSDALGAANTSGFPFQARVAQDVARLPAELHWETIGTEMPWQDPDSGKSGFVDLVVRCGSTFLVIECKRRGGGPWTFLCESGTEPSRRIRYCYAHEGRLGLAEAIAFDPGSPEVEFCAVPGTSGAGDPRSLERIAAELVSATESLAHAAGGLQPAGEPLQPWAFIPVIVTNLKPRVLYFNADHVSLDTGEIPAGTEEVEDVKLVRFFKGFSHRELRPRRDLRSLQSIRREASRTVMVLDAEWFPSFLREVGYLAFRNMNNMALEPESDL